MSATLIPWPTHRRCNQMLHAMFAHVRDTLPEHGGRDWIALIAAVHSLVESDPNLARKLDTEFRRMQRAP